MLCEVFKSWSGVDRPSMFSTNLRDSKAALMSDVVGIHVALWTFVTSNLNVSLLFLCSSSVVTVNFPRFYGHSHMTFEPLKNSYQTFQITLEFKVKPHVYFFPHWCSFIKRIKELWNVFLCGAGRLGGRLVAILWRERTRPRRLHLFGSGARQAALQVKKNLTHLWV